MAITIETYPNEDYPSAQDTLWHVASSTNSAIPDFKYVFDVWVDGVQKIRVKQYPEPGTNYGYFDASVIVKNSIEYNWFTPSASDQTVNVNGWKVDYQVRYGEEYSGSTYLNLASGETTAYNWRPDLFKRKAFNLFVEYQNYFLTQRDRVVYCNWSKRFWVAFLYKQVGYKIYDQNGSIIDSDDNFYDAGAGNLAQFECSQILVSALSANAKYVDIIMYDGGDEVGGTLRIYNKCNNKYQTIPIHFLNAFGAWETLHFTLASRLTMDVERKGFEKRDFAINGASVDYYNIDKYEESKINYQNKMNWSYRLTADAMSDTDWQWASQLISSPQILMEVDDFFYPVTIKNTNYEYSKYVNNRQRALEVDFEMNQTRYSHLR